MSRKYEFDKQYLKSILNKGNIILIKNNLSEFDQKIIQEDVSFLRRVLSNDFKFYEGENPNEYKTFKALKNELLIYLKKMYHYLGEALINYLIDLEEEQIFDDPQSFGYTFLSVDEMVELTLKNYEENSRFLLGTAKQIISSRPTNQIQVVEDLGSSSYCHCSTLTELPFLIIDPLEKPQILNHELEHGIEFSLAINYNDVFSELGAIYFEMLFTDVLYKSKGFIFPDSYTGRIEDASYQLRYLTPFFKIMKIFAKNNFKVSDDCFKQILLENINVMDNDIESYLRQEDVIGDIDGETIYLLSFLKAIELREKTKGVKDDKLIYLTPYTARNKLNFGTSKSTFKIYKDYILEMKSKVKIK